MSEREVKQRTWISVLTLISSFLVAIVILLIDINSKIVFYGWLVSFCVSFYLCFINKTTRNSKNIFGSIMVTFLGPVSILTLLLVALFRKRIIEGG